MTAQARRSIVRFSAAGLAAFGLAIGPAGVAATGPESQDNAAPAAAQPGEAQPGEAQPGEAQPGEAQPGAGQPPAAMQQPSTAQGEVSDQKLKQFAAAAAEVQQIQQAYAAEAQTLQKNTEEKIVASVEDAGMSVAEFTALVERVQTDPALARRLDSMQTQGQGQ